MPRQSCHYAHMLYAAMTFCLRLAPPRQSRRRLIAALRHAFAFSTSRLIDFLRRRHRFFFFAAYLRHYAFAFYLSPLFAAADIDADAY